MIQAIEVYAFDLEKTDACPRGRHICIKVYIVPRRRRPYFGGAVGAAVAVVAGCVHSIQTTEEHNH